jgi:hypothetical protein
MCEVRSGGKMVAKKFYKKKSTVINSKKKKDCDEPNLASNEKTQPIQWTELVHWWLLVHSG